MPAMKEILVDTASGNAWTNRTPWQISRNGIDGSTPSSTPIHSGMSKYSNPDSSDSSGTRIRIGTSDTTNSPPWGLNVSPNIGSIWQSATPYLIKSNKLDAAIDGKFPDNLIEPPIFTDVLSEKLSNSSIQYLCTPCPMNFSAYPVNIPGPKFVDFGLSNIDALDKGTSLWTPASGVGRLMDVTYWSAPDHIFGKTTSVVDAVRTKSDYNYKTDFEIWRKNQ